MTTTLATVAGPDGPRLLVRHAGRLYAASDRPGSGDRGDVGDLFRRGPDAVDALRAWAAELDQATPIATDEADLTFLPPVARPGKIVCVGLNYRLHAEEGGVAVPTAPVLFAKFPNTLIGHGAPIVYPRITTQLDYEGELAVIIGRRASRVAVADALRYVGAYTILDDVSARDLQSSEPQWIRAKSLDTFAPVGPHAVLPDEGFDPATFRIRTTVSGDLRQDSSCGDMVFSVAELIAFISEAITLDPGDIISTGTPSGVGLGFDPPRYLSPGDTVTIEIDGIGVLTNPVVAAS
jgi:2-keto-4-pentenoate hydratase/2-oxohepta-3-ene-1,7-dioic acid hydratase in catechol pathway